MLQQLINHSPDIEKLVNKGYSVNYIDGYLVVEHIPYVTSNKIVKWGALVAPLNLNPDFTVLPPSDHVIKFIGDFPCNENGDPISSIQHGNGEQLTSEFKIDFSFSNKPSQGLCTYYDKFVHYIGIISSPARYIDDNAKPNLGRAIQIISTQANNNFNYVDTNSTRASISNYNDRFSNLKIAIIGLGGTGSYLLDFISKTNVKEIHLYDKDIFSSHNAFRTPGAPDIIDLNGEVLKSDYLYRIYSKMHAGLINHKTYVNPNNLNELLDYDFVFVSIDNGKSRSLIVKYLLSKDIPFVDVGIGIDIKGDSLAISARVSVNEDPTVSLDRTEDALIDDDIYKTNIQIAEINALNACMAIIKWKQYYEFYSSNDKNIKSSDFIGEPFKIFSHEE